MGLNGVEVEVQEVSSEQVWEFPSLRQAALHLKTTRTTLRKYILEEKLFQEKYIVKFKKKDLGS